MLTTRPPKPLGGRGRGMIMAYKIEWIGKEGE
jgi:hypothetical protein